VSGNRPIHVLMLGWEFPPYISGGLGTACHGLTRALDRRGIAITFVMPRAVLQGRSGTGFTEQKEWDTGAIRSSDPFANLSFAVIPMNLRPYGLQGPQPNGRQREFGALPGTHIPRKRVIEGAIYGAKMLAAVERYAKWVVDLAARSCFDLVHAHDWMTFPAAAAVARASGKPFIAHVHSTEFDRSGTQVNQAVYDIERAGMHAANKIISVSNYTRNMLVRHYGVAPARVQVVYNGVDFADSSGSTVLPSKDGPMVLFLGRITMQKGPDYFLAAAKRVLEVIDNVTFVMAGEGDMLPRMIEQAAALGIGQKVLFTRFLQGEQVACIFRMADLYVMPSVSEPFGIAPLEALSHNVPVIISKQSGVSEVLTHALKVDFWDIDQMANKMIAVLKHAPLRDTLRAYGRNEARGLRWEDAASTVERIYSEVLAQAACK